MSSPNALEYSEVEGWTDLSPLHSFGLEAKARGYVGFSSVEDLRQKLKLHADRSILILGEGSNVVFLEDFDGFVLKNEIVGKRWQKRDERWVEFWVGAGENWHELVLWSLDQGLKGMENLALIPGSVGAAPVQNIGAYGKEFKDIALGVRVYDRLKQEEMSFDVQQCGFGYRDSIFKAESGRYVILEVGFCLDQEAECDTRYGDVQKTCLQRGVENPCARDVAEAVIEIRRSKLPDPLVLGNSGSFFKNPVIPKEQALALLNKHPEAKVFELGDQNGSSVQGPAFKVAAGWLIDRLGWKGRRLGPVGVHEHQALVLVNHGGAKGGDLLALVEQIRLDVWQHFGICLEPEVQCVGAHGERIRWKHLDD